jgi:hypothetical protein
VSNNISFVSFQCDSEGEDDKVSIKPECYLGLLMVLWRVSLSHVVTEQFIKTCGVCLLQSLMGLFAATFIFVRIGEPAVRNG